jgi:hypothetical protein
MFRRDGVLGQGQAPKQQSLPRGGGSGERVRGKGLEPLQPSGHKALNLARLPNSATRAHGGHVWPRLGHVKQPKSLVPFRWKPVLIGDSNGVRSQVSLPPRLSTSRCGADSTDGASTSGSAAWMPRSMSSSPPPSVPSLKASLDRCSGVDRRASVMEVNMKSTATTVVARESILPAPRGPNMDEEEPPPNAAPTSEPLEGCSRMIRMRTRHKVTCRIVMKRPIVAS